MRLPWIESFMFACNQSSHARCKNKFAVDFKLEPLNDGSFYNVTELWFHKGCSWFCLALNPLPLQPCWRSLCYYVSLQNGKTNFMVLRCLDYPATFAFYPINTLSEYNSGLCLSQDFTCLCCSLCHTTAFAVVFRKVEYKYNKNETREHYLIVYNLFKWVPMSY